jgi:hypothetical protein
VDKSSKPAAASSSSGLGMQMPHPSSSSGLGMQMPHPSSSSLDVVMEAAASKLLPAAVAWPNISSSSSSPLAVPSGPAGPHIIPGVPNFFAPARPISAKVVAESTVVLQQLYLYGL